MRLPKEFLNQSTGTHLQYVSNTKLHSCSNVILFDKTSIRYRLPHLLQRDCNYKVRNLQRNVAQRWHVYLQVFIGAFSKLKRQERREILVCVREREDISVEMKLTVYERKGM